MTNLQKPLVSVCMITYNHEKYIAQAIESVLMQKKDFPVELVIGDDCSTDRTREIVSEYQRRHPTQIRTLLQGSNLGASGKHNFVQTYQACQGEYIALIDGDDYWIDENKLQMGVTLLNAHPEWAICFHSAHRISANGDELGVRAPENKKAFYTQQEIIQANAIPTASVVFRNRLVSSFPDWFTQMMPTDWPLFVLLTAHGDAGYIDVPMSVHRTHPGGVGTSLSSSQSFEVILQVYTVFEKNLDSKFQPLLRRCRCIYLQKLVGACAREGLKTDARKYLWQLIKLRCVGVPPFQLLKSFWKAYLPGRA